jgi:DNA-binding winged helix-turn-helix (wHTH) protein
MRLQFDDLRFDPDTRQIWTGAREVRLSPKAFDLLALLIARRPHAVSKADIRKHLWPGTFVSESSLPSLVSEIRDAIADHRRKPGLLRTVHGFGYAFQFERSPEGAAAPNAWLLGSTAEVALQPGENILGREGEGIVVKSSTVSRRHARLVLGPAGAVVEDLGSKNGTYVNDRRVTAPMPIVDGDQVRIGSLLFTFRMAQGTETTETQSSRSGRRLRR